MTNEERQNLEEKAADHRRQVKEKGYSERNGERFYEARTVFGNASFITIPEQLRNYFKNQAIIHMLLSSGFTLNKKQIERYLLDPEVSSMLDKLLINHIHPDRVQLINKTANKAVNYFLDNLKEMISTTIYSYFDESFVYGLIKTNKEENRESPETEVNIFNGFVEFGKSRLRARLGIQKASGAKTKRTEEELQEMALFYDLSLPLVKEAKKSYTHLKGKHGWVKAIKVLHPDVPESIIEKFDQKGVMPSYLTLNWITDFFNVEQTDYLRQQILKTRKNIVRKTPVTKELLEELFG